MKTLGSVALMALVAWPVAYGLANSANSSTDYALPDSRLNSWPSSTLRWRNAGCGLFQRT
ncbi:MAG: hypothetical protein R3C59_14555 [Planctomycetaceae bacterium]